MSKLKFINWPQITKRESYDEAIGIISTNLIKHPNVKAIYQFGNITTPGISDIDLLVVAKENCKIELNGFEGYPNELKNLFTHGIMAISEKQYAPNNFYSIWSDHHLIAGSEIISNNEIKRTELEEDILKRQIALEFILMNYIDIKIQLTYSTIKLRSFLQHIKGVKYDLEFLNITDNKLYELISQVNKWIKSWFDEIPSQNALTKFIWDFNIIYEQFVIDILTTNTLFLPTSTSINISKKIKLINSPEIKYERNGILIPVIVQPLLGDKFIKFQNKFNSFDFFAPFTNVSNNSILIERFEFLSDMKKYNNQYLPNFSTLTSSITAKII